MTTWPPGVLTELEPPAAVDMMAGISVRPCEMIWLHSSLPSLSSLRAYPDSDPGSLPMLRS